MVKIICDCGNELTEVDDCDINGNWIFNCKCGRVFYLDEGVED